MKKFLPIHLLVFLSTFIIVSGFINSKTKRPILPKKVKKNFAYVSSGKVLIEKDTFKSQAFYISKYEVTNLEYREFLEDLKNQGRTKDLAIAKLDTSRWIENLSYGEPYMEYYHAHPAYDTYPVVNVSYEGAELYCKWLSEKYNENNDSKVKLDFRLPTKIEWVRAARGEQISTIYSTKNGKLIDKKGKVLCNFITKGAESIHYDKNEKKYEVILDKDIENQFQNINADITAPSKSYYPNSIGIYNMSGNVGEMLIRKNGVMGGSWKSPGYDVRIENHDEYEGSSPTVGFRIVFTYLVQG